MVFVKVGSLEIGFDGGDRGFYFVGGISDEDFLRLVGGADGFYGFFGRKTGKDKDEDFDGDASDDEGKEETAERGATVGENLVFDDGSELGGVGRSVGKLEDGFAEVERTVFGGVFDDEIDS